MTLDEALAAFALPPQARLDRRVPKKQLLESGAPTAADKRAITDGIEELIWVAPLKPTNVGVPEYKDDDRHYIEIAVLTLTFRPGARADRLRELVHRAIPYPVVLMSTDDTGVVLSLAHLRHAQNEAGKVVVDGELLAAAIPAGSWSQRLAFHRQPTADLHALYNAWYRWLQPLVKLAQMDGEVADLRHRAEREPQLNRRVELNLDMQRRLVERNRLAADIQASGAA